MQLSGELKPDYKQVTNDEHQTEVEPTEIINAYRWINFSSLSIYISVALALALLLLLLLSLLLPLPLLLLLLFLSSLKSLTRVASPRITVVVTCRYGDFECNITETDEEAVKFDGGPKVKIFNEGPMVKD